VLMPEARRRLMQRLMFGADGCTASRGQRYRVNQRLKDLSVVIELS
jgi:hypothetical protein